MLSMAQVCGVSAVRDEVSFTCQSVDVFDEVP